MLYFRVSMKRGYNPVQLSHELIIYIYMSVYLFVCLSVFLSVCLSVYISCLLHVELSLLSCLTMDQHVCGLPIICMAI